MLKLAFLLPLFLALACNPLSDGYEQPSSPDMPPQYFAIPQSPTLVLTEDVPPFQAVGVACWLNPSPAFSDTGCDGITSFPYTVPAGRGFCLTHLAMVNKFPYNPSQYGGDMRSMYFVLFSDFGGWSVPAHHHEYHFRPAVGPFPAGTVIHASVLNNMNEAQNMMGQMGGYLVPAPQGCDL